MRGVHVEAQVAYNLLAVPAGSGTSVKKAKWRLDISATCRSYRLFK